MKRRFYIISFITFVFLLPWINSTCQSGLTKDLSLRGAYRHGFILPEYSLFNYLVDDYVHSFELAVSRQTSGKNYWSQVYNYPEYGLALQYSTLGNKEIFGSEISFYPFFEVHLIDAGKFSLINQVGFGLGLVNKKFNAETNPYNLAIGTNLNLHFNFELNAEYQIRPKLFLYTGLSMDHLSNGNLGEPNLGINFITFNGGLRYLAGSKSDRTKIELPKHIPSTDMAIILSIGKKHAHAAESKAYLISSLSYELKRKLWRTFYPGIGADIFYDASTEAEAGAITDHDFRSIDDFKTGLHLSQEFVYDRFSVSLQEGFYIGLKDNVLNHSMYNRFIVRHRIGNRFFIQLAMKSHLVILDFIELGIGYRGKS